MAEEKASTYIPRKCGELGNLQNAQHQSRSLNLRMADAWMALVEEQDWLNGENDPARKA